MSRKVDDSSTCTPPSTRSRISRLVLWVSMAVVATAAPEASVESTSAFTAAVNSRPVAASRGSTVPTTSYPRSFSESNMSTNARDEPSRIEADPPEESCQGDEQNRGDDLPGLSRRRQLGARNSAAAAAPRSSPISISFVLAARLTLDHRRGSDRSSRRGVPWLTARSSRATPETGL